MTEEYLAEALQQVSDEHLMEAALPLRRRRGRRAALGFAACFAVVTVLSLLMQPLFSADSAMESESAANEGAMEDTEASDPYTGSFDGTADGAFLRDAALTAEDVSSAGLTLVITQQDGPEGETLFTGSYFTIQRQRGSEWDELSPIGGTPAWTDEQLAIPAGDSVRWTVDWRWLYGELEPGHYRIGKELSDDSGSSCLCWAEFDI